MKKLNERQVQIIKLICDGLPIKAIADRLHLSPKTIEWNIYDENGIHAKTGVYDIANLVRYAIRNNIIEA